MYMYDMTAIGLKHEHANVPCENHVATFQWNGAAAQVCAAGTEEGCRSSVEARRLSVTAAQFMAMYYQQLKGMTDDQVRGEVLELIRSVQDDLEDEGKAYYDEMGCTLVAAVMDRRSFEYIGVSIGDGILLARERFSRSISAVLPPEKRADGGAYLTTEEDEELLAHIRIVRGRAKDALMVSSSGLESTLWDVTGQRISATVGKLMEWVVEDPEGVREDFAEAVYDLSLPEDVGVAVMVDNRTTLRPAMATRPKRRRRSTGSKAQKQKPKPGWNWLEMRWKEEELLDMPGAWGANSGQGSA